MKTLTIFTPAFNRAHTITRTYESLCRQTLKDFEWLIVDDGSSDNTSELVKQWIPSPNDFNATPGLQATVVESFEGMCSHGFHITYIKQKNQGMHGAHNTAYKNIKTELNTCIDSDDWMPDDAVESIVKFWHENGSDKYAGIIALDSKENGDVIGNQFPASLKETTLRDYYEKHQGSGDKKLIYRTDVITRYAEYPIFPGEKYVGLAYKYNLADVDYKLLTFNHVCVIVDYQIDGSSFGMWKQYWNNPKGWSFLRKFDMLQTKSFKRKIIDNVHYVSHSIRIGNKHFIAESPMKLLTCFCLLPGVFLYFMNKNKVRRNAKFSINK